MATVRKDEGEEETQASKAVIVLLLIAASLLFSMVRIQVDIGHKVEIIESTPFHPDYVSECLDYGF